MPHWTHEDIRITFEENRGLFELPPHVGPPQPSLEAAREYIDKWRTNEKRKAAQNKTKLSVALYDMRGTPLTLTGFHRGNGSPIFAGNTRPVDRALYVNSPGVKAVLDEISALDKKRAELWKSIQPARVELPYLSARMLSSVEAYDKAVTEFKQHVAKQLQSATKAGL